MPTPITEIPAHIRALPEEEQGPALVKAIHDRKADTQLRATISAEVNEICAEQYDLGVRSAIASIRAALAAYTGALPAESLLIPGADRCLQIIGQIQKEVLGAKAQD